MGMPRPLLMRRLGGRTGGGCFALSIGDVAPLGGLAEAAAAAAAATAGTGLAAPFFSPALSVEAAELPHDEEFDAAT